MTNAELTRKALTMNKKLATLALASTVALTLIAGCASTHQDAPDPTAANTHPGTNEAVMQFPDGFRNVAFECHGTTGVYVTSRGQTSDIITSGIAVLANDPACR